MPAEDGVQIPGDERGDRHQFGVGDIEESLDPADESEPKRGDQEKGPGPETQNE
jgi:hypothetical protein